jgi:hypothetical protein
MQMSFNFCSAMHRVRQCRRLVQNANVFMDRQDAAFRTYSVQLVLVSLFRSADYCLGVVRSHS